jgi:ankyrin repeat protein
MKSLSLFLLVALHALPAANTPAELLAKASRLGDLKTAEVLLSSGADPNAPDRYGATPLYYAASFNHVEMVQLLLAYHADPNAPVKMNRRKDDTEPPNEALQYAAGSGNIRIVSTLLAAGAEIDTKGAQGRTALHFAGTQVAVMHVLIEHGADVTVRDGEGVAPLDQAVWNGSLDAVAILLAHGARLNEAEPATGATPINEAAYRGHAAVVQYLLRFNPDLAVADNRHNTPLENAIRFRHEDSALLLLQAEAKDKPPQFFAALMDPAIKKDESALVEKLLHYGVPVNDTLPAGFTLLETAAFAGSVKVARVLLQSGADPNLSSRNGASPLENAALQGYDAIAALLLDRGAQLDHLNTASGATALYDAASFGRNSMVKLLLERGANPSLCGPQHKSPYQAALANGNTEVATLMQAHHAAEGCRP